MILYNPDPCRVMQGKGNDMQGTGFVVYENEKILVLCRQSKTYRSYRLRKTGKAGNYFEEDSKYFTANDIKKLLDGETVFI